MCRTPSPSPGSLIGGKLCNISAPNATATTTARLNSPKNTQHGCLTARDAELLLNGVAQSVGEKTFCSTVRRLLSSPTWPTRRLPHDTYRMTLVPCANLGGDHCDFCQSSPVFTVYPCSNFLHNGLPVFLARTTGTWATCRKCAELVDGKKWSDLTERAYRRFLKRHGASRHEQLVVRAQFAELSRLFAAHMLGRI
jgi:hypothetical protein